MLNWNFCCICPSWHVVTVCWHAFWANVCFTLGNLCKQKKRKLFFYESFV
jgi:hypothetical protein